MKINKEGYKIIGITGTVCVLFWALIYYLLDQHANVSVMWLSALLLVLFWFFIVAFFREPRRVRIHDADLVFSPCDGRVVVTELVEENEYLHERMLQISIFMSITNVHMNWVPVGGEVEYFKYHPGLTRGRADSGRQRAARRNRRSGGRLPNPHRPAEQGGGREQIDS